ncbi:hypothetical protein ACFL60_06765 [Candidatus Omnitrophota bacterium]
MNVGFDDGIKLEFHGSTVTSYERLLAHRDFDDTLGYSAQFFTVITIINGEKNEFKQKDRKNRRYVTT